MSYTWYEWATVFVIYAVIGWILEVSYAALEDGKFVNRGFLNGPVCPIYGFGGSIVIACLYPYREQFLLVFFGAIILSTVLEYVTGYVLEKIFHEQWWDYSELPFNIKGYVCLKFSVLWGLACVLVVDVIHPPIEHFVLWIPEKVEVVAIVGMFVIFVADLSVTITTIIKWKKQLVLMNEMVEILRGFSDGVGDNISAAVLKAMSKGTEWKDVFEKDERYLEMKDELEARKQELDKLKIRYVGIVKMQSRRFKRLEKAYPKLRYFNPMHVKEKWNFVKEKGIRYGRTKE